MKKLSLILASVALFATVANAQTDSSKSASTTSETKTETGAPKTSSKSASATTETKPETGAPKTRKGNKAKAAPVDAKAVDAKATAPTAPTAPKAKN
jgi:hypothetical protein